MIKLGPPLYNVSFERRDVITVASDFLYLWFRWSIDYEDLVVSLRPGMIKIGMKL